MYTMYRCALTALIAACITAPAMAQVPMQRNFPQNALRGDIIFLSPPEITLNGQPMRLAPGSRIRGQNNMIQMSGSLAGQQGVVHYTLDITPGLVKDIWILRPDELEKKPWPATPEEAQTWSFDPVAQRWTKP
jgi:hypothetical protein